MAGPLTGGDCKLYYNSGTYASPTWVEITNAIDVDLDPEAGEAAVPSRASVWELSLPGRLKLSLSFGYLYRAGVSDAVYTALMNAFFNRTLLEFAIMDGAIATAGNKGVRMIGMAKKPKVGQKLADAVQVDFEFAAAYREDSGTLREPSQYTVP